MSAEEIIELIKNLPPEEKAAVIAFVDRERAADKPVAQYLPHDEAERISEEIFKRNERLFRKLAQ